MTKQQQEHLVVLGQARKELEALNETKDKFLSNLGREISTAAGRLSTTGADEDACNAVRLLETILEWPRLQAGQKLDLLSFEINSRRDRRDDTAHCP